MKAKEIFKICFGGSKNALSDKILKYGKIGLNSAWEISKGASLEDQNKNTFAVSVVILDTKGERDILSHNYFNIFDNYESALSYAEGLKDFVKNDLKTFEKAEMEKPIIEDLKKIFEGNNKVYCVLKYVSQNGMNRHISFFTIKENEHINLNNYILKLLSYNGSNEYIKVGGCGMDMGFSVVYDLSSKVFKGVERSGYILTHNWV